MNSREGNEVPRYVAPCSPLQELEVFTGRNGDILTLVSPMFSMVPAVKIDCLEVTNLTEGTKHHISNEPRKSSLGSAKVFQPGNWVLLGMLCLTGS